MDGQRRKKVSKGEETSLPSLDTDSAGERFTAALLDWYVDVRRDLPWRRDATPYRVWVSEVMLQQTRVETVIPYFERFLTRFPTLQDLADSSEDDVLALWSGLGYYRRARSLRKGAQAVVEDHGGEFPRTLEEALALPGVGPYTAAAILSIAYGRPHPVVDGNVERVVCRLLRLSDNPKQAATKAKLRRTLEQLISPDRASDFNQALMELGATVCSPLAPRCDRCPVGELCQARALGDPESFPVQPQKRKTVPVDLEVGVLRRGDEFLLEQVRDKSYLQGLWLFPVVDRADDENDITRALSEKLGVGVERGAALGRVRHSITYRRITLHPTFLDAEEVDLDGKPEFRWARLEDLGERVPVSSICTKIAERIREAAAKEDLA